MHFVITAAAAVAGALLFHALKVPAGYLVGAMLAVAVVNLVGSSAVELPAPLSAAAYIGIGWLIGQGITTGTVTTVARNAGTVTAIVAALVAAGGLAAFALTRLGPIDPATAFLATSPGGLSQMAALGAAVGANAGFVATVHLIRVVTVIVLAPWVVRVLPNP